MNTVLANLSELSQAQVNQNGAWNATTEMYLCSTPDIRKYLSYVNCGFIALQPPS